MSSRSREQELLSLPQGDLRLLETEVARRLLASAGLARWPRTGTQPVMPAWFHWTGDELVMATSLLAPHVPRPATCLRALRADPDVDITTDTATAPPHVLLIRGRALVTEVDGIAAELMRSHAGQYPRSWSNEGIFRRGPERLPKEGDGSDDEAHDRDT